MQRHIAGYLIAALAALTTYTSGHAASQPPGGASTARVAFTRNNNVFLMNGTGKVLGTVTTRGTGYAAGSRGIVYPWYSWSPDGRYLLLIRSRPMAATASLLLLNQNGAVLRTLATIPAEADFWPSWAIDANQIAFVSAKRSDQTYGGFHNTVSRIDLQGRRSFLLSYPSHEGCGGGTGDPAQARYMQETGFGGLPSFSWSVSQGIAAYTASCAGGVNVTDMRTHNTRSFPRWNEPALSTRGTLAVVNRTNAPTPPALTVVLANPRSGSVLRRVAPGELPLWSQDGRSLYFVQRTLVSILHARDGLGNQRDLQIFRSAIYRVNANGTGLGRLLSEDAFGFGPLNLTSNGRSLIFSRVDNDWAVWRHRKGNVIAPDQGRYAPKVQIQRLDLGRGVVTLAANAGRPVVQR